VTDRSRKPYIAGNWKMNLDRSRSLDLIKTVKGRIGDGNDREVAFFVPSIYLADVSAVAQGSPLGVGGQNVWFEAIRGSSRTCRSGQERPDPGRNYRFGFAV
jgi:triosephosphate isomerase